MLFDSIPRAFGLDIGDQTLKMIILERQKSLRGKIKYSLKNFREIDLPTGLIVDGEIKDPLKVKIYLKTLLQNAVRGRVKIRGVICSLPENKTFLKEKEAKYEIPYKSCNFYFVFTGWL